jgi:threonine aldolase
LKLHARPGDVLIAEEHSHVLVYEFGGAAVHAGLLSVGLPGGGGRLTATQVAAAASTAADTVDQRPAVLVLENTHNVAGGRVWPLDELDAVVGAARGGGLGVHLDGARLMNAATALGVPASAIGSRVDTVTLCLSKGLGCPLGAVLAGPADLIEVAWREKFLFGGAMRQSGMIAAAALYALDHHVERLAIDHDRARRLAEAWAAGGVPVELDRVETNFVQIDASRLGLRRTEAIQALRDAGVAVSPTYGPTHIRAVTHLELDDADIDRACEVVPEVLTVAGEVERGRDADIGGDQDRAPEP